MMRAQPLPIAATLMFFKMWGTAVRHLTPQVWMRQRLLPESVSVVLPLELLQRGDAGGANEIVRVLRLQVSRGVLSRLQRVRKTVAGGVEKGLKKKRKAR